MTCVIGINPEAGGVAGWTRILDLVLSTPAGGFA